MQQRTKKIIQKFFLVPQRYVFAVMGFLSIINAYQLRVCLNVAITEMVVAHSTDDEDSPYYDPDACPDDNRKSSQNNTITNSVPGEDLFDWDEQTQGLILSSFFWGYVITHIPGGLWSDKFGGKHALGVGIFATSIFTFLIPVAAKAGYGWLLAARVITGLGEGTTMPALNGLLAKWIPLHERGFIGTFVYSGSQIGTVTGTLLSGYLLHVYKGNWPLVFYFFGGIGVLWCILWGLLCYSGPETHPFITDKEKLFLTEAIGKRKQDVPPTPWRHILKSFPVWALVFAAIGHDWAWFTMVTDLPKYMKDVLKFSIGANGVLSSTPYLITWILSLALGWIGDQIIKRKWLSVTATRKMFTSIAHIGPSLALIAASYAGCDRTVAVVLFNVTVALIGAYYPGMKVNSLDLSPNYASTIMAISNGLGALSGIVTPYLVGVLTPNHTLLEWRLVFWINIAVNIFTLIIFLWGGSGEIQPWDDINREKKEEDEKRHSIFSNETITNEKL